jgi:hypothetical protein
MWHKLLPSGKNVGSPEKFINLSCACSGQQTKWNAGICPRAVPIRDARGQIVEWIGTNTDIHDRKQAQLNEQFLSDLELRLRQGSNPAEMFWESMNSLGEYLNVDRCIWHEIDAEADLAIVPQDWHQPHLDSATGTYQISDFKTPETESSLYGRSKQLSSQISLMTRRQRLWSITTRPLAFALWSMFPAFTKGAGWLFWW